MNNVYTVPIPFASSPVVRGSDFFADINIICWPCYMARPGASLSQRPLGGAKLPVKGLNLPLGGHMRVNTDDMRLFFTSCFLKGHCHENLF